MPNFLNISDLNKQDILEILDLSKKIESNNKAYDLKNKNIGLIFEKPSTRTRLSFLTGCHELKANPIEIDFKNLNFSRNESFIDTIKMFNLYLDFLIYRTSNHGNLITASQYFTKPIVNALSDLSHPCQILADYFTLKELFPNQLIKISWFGDVNNVLFSLSELTEIADIELTIFTDLTLNSKINHKNKKIEIKNQICFETLNSTNCVMTDVYTSMNDTFDDKKKSKLLNFQVNEQIMQATSSDTVFMHCLPANIGEEVTENVLESEKSIILRQAYNRKVIQKGLLYWLNSKI